MFVIAIGSNSVAPFLHSGDWVGLVEGSLDALHTRHSSPHYYYYYYYYCGYYCYPMRNRRNVLGYYVMKTGLRNPR